MPDDALREAILNALIHRDYGDSAPIQIRVYENRLRIWNPAELPEGWTKVKLLGEHPSRPFNPSVANVFFRAGEIEAWGHGIQRIFNACRKAGTPKPKINYEPGEISIEFPFASNYMKVVSGGSSTTGRLDERLSENRAAIVRIMRSNSSITVTEIGKLIGISRTATDKNIQYLKKEGWIRRVGPAKGGKWEVLET